MMGSGPRNLLWTAPWLRPEMAGQRPASWFGGDTPLVDGLVAEGAHLIAIPPFQQASGDGLPEDGFQQPGILSPRTSITERNQPA